MPKNRAQRDSSVLLFLFQAIKPHKQWAAAGAFLSLASAATALMLTYFTQRLVTQTIQGVIQPVTVWLFVLLVIVSALTGGISGASSGRLGALVGRDLKRSVADKTMQAEYRFVRDISAGDAVSVVNSDCNRISSFVSSDLFSLVTQTLTAICAFIYLLTLHPTVGLLTFAYTPVGMVLAGTINRRLNALYPASARQKGEALSAVEQALASLPVIKSFTMERSIRKRLDLTFEKLYETDKRIKWWDSLLQPACLSVANAPHLIFTVAGGLYALSGQLELAVFIAIVQLLGYIIPPTVMLPFMINNLNQAAASMKRVERLTNLPSESGNDNRISAEAAAKPSVEFRNVSFAYDAENPVLMDVSFAAERPGIIAVVGGSGSGKTTIGSLLSGLFRPDVGSIVYCGQDGASLNAGEFGKLVAVMPQDIYLFSASILDNVRMGKESAERGDIVAAARAAGVSDFNSHDEHGLDTPIGDGGASLSGGQAQKLALARVLLKDSPIWFLDEPTSALDAASEQLTHELIRTMASTKLIMIAAHRMSTIRLADRIIYVKDGKVAADGAWEQLTNNAELMKTIRADRDSEESGVLAG
ncbi:ABC transporter ATP-binding protein [Paenibacillus thermotolerans]|uniref:ABC transporter ATP-binding protein n=1 Tax=Paenibacillus thermotolerans TaxID=3027807 RepID=UPI002367F19F|nr:MULTISPECIES: ABC transporter ATP-binding protein [unclassified Paenibacillus]